MKTEIHLTCPCGDKFTRGELPLDKAAEITQLWKTVHDGAVCFVSKTAERFWRELRAILPTNRKGGK